MAECSGCNQFVTDDYARVFGDNNDVVETCRNCRSERSTDRGKSEAEAGGERVLLRDVRDTSSDDEGGSSDEATSAAGRTRKGSRFGLSTLRGVFGTADG